MSLYEKFKKYLKDDLFDYFTEKRKVILEINKKDYLNCLIKDKAYIFSGLNHVDYYYTWVRWRWFFRSNKFI